MRNGGVSGSTARFYAQLLSTLQQHGLPFLVGGAYGFAHFTGIHRPTKDLDLFVCQRDWQRLVQIAAAAGHRAELAYPHWLGKIQGEAGLVDVIFNSGNGLSPVDDSWFAHAPDALLFGQPVKLMPAEECIWTKAFIMERERYDGADVVHLIHARAPWLDWPRLLQRFGPHWRVLLSHLVLFGFIFPRERGLVPRWLMDQLTERLRAQTHGESPRDAPCAGTLLSREQYLSDVAHKGYQDMRLPPHGTLSDDDVAGWTAAIDARAAPPAGPAPRAGAVTPTAASRSARRSRRDRRAT